MSSGFKIECPDDIFEIPDVRTAIGILQKWGVSTQGIKNIQDCQDRMLQHWSSTNSNRTETFKGFRDVIIASKKNRDELVYYYGEMLNLYRTLPASQQGSLNTVFPNLEDATHQKIRELKSNECAILIAGESVAGKSSFVNLLLGINLLPTSNLACTATFCEIRYSSKKIALCFDGRGCSRKIDLSTNEGLEDLRQSISYVTDDVDDNPYERIEIYWPTEMLEDGIVIIDTPGIGTSKEMTERIQQYMKKSFGCIYIINSSTAGGVQKGRIMEFLRTVITLTEDQYSPDTTMFVFNKWDTVPKSDREHLLDVSYQKLKQCYQDIRPHQIFTLSTNQAREASNHGLVLKNYKDVLGGLKRLLPASLENKHEAYYRWLSVVLKRTQFTLKLSNMYGKENKEQLREKIGFIEKQMLILRNKANDGIKTLNEEVQKETENLHFKIINLLTSPDFLSSLSTWEKTECPSSDRKWKKVSEAANEKISERITDSINVWERQHEARAGIKKRIIGRFQKEFELMEDQINDIEGIFLEDQNRILKDLHTTIKRKDKKKKGKDKGKSKKLVGIGGVVGFLGTLGKESKEIFQRYKPDNCSKSMNEATNLFINNVLKNNTQLKEDICSFIQKYAKGINRIAELIPDFLDADQKMLMALKEKEKQTEADHGGSSLRKFVDMQSHLDLFYVDAMMHPEYEMSNVKLVERLGHGTFAEVYRGFVSENDPDDTEVALKISIDCIDKKTVTNMLLEDRTMREIRHKNFVHYYGCGFRPDGRKSRWVMVMECCMGTLKDVFVAADSDLKIETPANANTMSEGKKALQNMAFYIVQLCDGLSFLHGKKMIHRDLKLENVLVSKPMQVKIADLGLTIPENFTIGGGVGTPIYMAPELMKSPCVPTSAADIYSLGIMIWEMWYGIDAANNADQECYSLVDSFLDAVQRGRRPPLTLNQKPEEKLKILIEKCWNHNPNYRPTAKVVAEFFSAYQ